MFLFYLIFIFCITTFYSRAMPLYRVAHTKVNVKEPFIHNEYSNTFNTPLYIAEHGELKVKYDVQ